MRITRAMAPLLAVSLGMALPSCDSKTPALPATQKAGATPANFGFKEEMKKIMWRELWLEGDRYCKYLQGAGFPDANAQKKVSKVSGDLGAELGLLPGKDFSSALYSLKANEYGPRPEAKATYCYHRILSLSKDNTLGIIQFFAVFIDKSGNPYSFERKVAFEGHTKIHERVYGSGEREMRIIPFWVTSTRYPFGIGFEKKCNTIPPALPDTRNWWQKHLGKKPFEEVQAPPRKFIRRKVPAPRMQQKRPTRLRRI